MISKVTTHSSHAPNQAKPYLLLPSNSVSPSPSHAHKLQYQPVDPGRADLFLRSCSHHSRGTDALRIQCRREELEKCSDAFNQSLVFSQLTGTKVRSAVYLLTDVFPRQGLM